MILYLVVIFLFSNLKSAHANVSHLLCGFGFKLHFSQIKLIFRKKINKNRLYSFKKAPLHILYIILYDKKRD